MQQSSDAGSLSYSFQSLNDVQEAFSDSFLSQFLLADNERICAIDSIQGTARNLWSDVPPATDEETCSDEEHSYDESLMTILGPNCTDLNPEVVLKSMTLEEVRASLEKSSLYRVYYNRYDKEGKQVYRKTTFRYLDDSRRFILLTIQDLTEAFMAEEARRKDLADALEDTRKHLDANNVFLSLLSRDIRTPLHSILGFTQIANAELSDVSAVEGYLHKISMSGIYMKETIDDIRDLIQILWNPIRLHKEPVSLSDFFVKISSFLRNKAEEKQLTLDSVSGPFSKDLVYTDKAILTKIITKLAGNITGYTLRGGNIHASAAEESISADTMQMVINVTSRGIDYDPRRLHVLEMSLREIQEELKRNISNVELDLVILKAYVSAMGGNITASASEGLGTHISIHLPLQLKNTAEGTETEQEAPASPVKEKPFASVPAFFGKSLLLADDDETNQEVERRMLERAGFTVTTARNGKEALDIYKSDGVSFDIVLLDVRMPCMDGLETARAIRSLPDPKKRSVPIIALTASTLPSDVYASLEAGMNRHVNKPLRYSELVDVLSAYI